MKLKFLLITLLVTFSQFALANIDAKSFTGTFKTKTCSFSDADTATITLNANILTVTFAGDINKAQFYTESVDFDDAVIEVKKDSFTITNEYFTKLEDGISPVMRTKIARSATGNRVRLNSLNFERGSESTCVLYRK